MSRKHLYGFRLWLRERLPWILIDLGIASKGSDCASVNAEHDWYSIDDKSKGCYYCKKISNGENGN